MNELSEADRILQEELENLNQQRQLILARLETKVYERINLNYEKAESTKKRTLRGVSDQQVKAIKRSAKDSITIAGIQGTLGERLMELGETLPTTDKQSKYIAYLCKNCVVDITPSNDVSQIELIGDSHTRTFMEKYVTAFGGTENSDNNIHELTKLFSKLKNKRKLKACYDEKIAKYKATNDIERAVHNIYKFVLEQHAFKSFMLTSSYINACSEQSINIKYWSYLFEVYFGRDNDIFLQWGETLAADCKNIALNFKLDLRIIVETEVKKHDIITGELVAPASTINSKMYNDKLKLVLVSKCHLNSLLSDMPFIPKTKIKLVRLPLIQIMGLTCHVHTLSLIDKGLYLLQKVYSVTYPHTHTHLETGGLQKIIQAFSTIEDMITDIRVFHRDYSVDTSTKSDRLLNVKKKSATGIEDWVSNVIWDGKLAEED